MPFEWLCIAWGKSLTRLPPIACVSCAHRAHSVEGTSLAMFRRPHFVHTFRPHLLLVQVRAFASDITYVTSNNLAFIFLRDNTCFHKDHVVGGRSAPSALSTCLNTCAGAPGSASEVAPL